MLKEGMTSSGTDEVTVANTAKAFRSGALEVYATPALASLMEEVCYKMVQSELEPGQGSVGTLLNIEHVAPSPVGMPITCQATLIKVDGRKLTFEVTASDKAGIIGKGTHERVIINNDRFIEKTKSKL